MDPWYRVAVPRKEVREGRSFNPDEFAIALEQVVAGTAPEDYRDPAPFFARTCFTRLFSEHTSMVLRRLAAETANTAPVMALITQFGGGKTHTLTALYHVTKHPTESAADPRVAELLRQGGLYAIPRAQVAVFVGNAWDPEPKIPGSTWLVNSRATPGSRPSARALGTFLPALRTSLGFLRSPAARFWSCSTRC